MTTGHDLKRLGLQYARSHSLFVNNPWNLPWPSLLLGWIATESQWNPYAIRYEPGFYYRYVPTEVKEKNETEARARAVSWGLGQIMGQVAREQGFDAHYLSELLDPEVNLRWCTRFLADRFEKSDSTWAGALASYNGGLGGNREPPYRNAAYVDRVVSRARSFAGDPRYRDLIREG